ncbi:NeuD/PglB/VioB family sugar acetyltransferase [Ilumatobacter sp.]|uniref:NeuD/PglB/VioB family sugar acetyltransferase n=1 Tax=Ilumatobacter sp. TaxID=1967498 RepID=UPI003AF5C9BE
MPVVVLGAGGHARVLVEALGARSVAGHLSRAADTASATPALGPRLGSDAEVRELAIAGHPFVLGIGFVDAPGSARRAELLRELADVELVTVRHRGATVSPGALVGAGTFIGPGSVVCVGVRLGRAAIVNSGAVVDHDCDIGDNVHVGPGATLSGAVRVGDNTLVGVGATVRQGIRIGSDVVVGAGAVVIDDLPDGVTALGVPARARAS